jgi:hypothetical protein
MPPPPLTHHQILALVEPFTRSGRQVDLAASDRLARRLHFKPVQRPGGDGMGTLTESLQLECHESGNHRLTRVLAPAQGHGPGPSATLQAMGTDLARLLAQVDAVPAARQFDSGPGWQVARSHDLAASAGGGTPALVFSQGEAWLDGLQFQLRVMDVKNVAGDISLRPAPGERLALPQDLLAVMGWNWVRLVPATDGWTSKLRLRGRGQARSAAAEQALGQAARHLAQVLAQPPGQYHARWRAARWGVVLRRSIPSLTALGLVVGALLLPRITGNELSGVWMALHYVPIAILALSFTVQELARFEIPPLPRRLKAAQWRSPAGRPALPAATAAAMLAPRADSGRAAAPEA